jgi:hypothetical protein
MKLTIDRFEAEYAVLELPDGSMVNLPRKVLPADAGEGDIINITVDRDETQMRKKEIQKLAEDLWTDA